MIFKGLLLLPFGPVGSSASSLSESTSSCESGRDVHSCDRSLTSLRTEIAVAPLELIKVQACSHRTEQKLQGARSLFFKPTLSRRALSFFSPAAWTRFNRLYTSSRVQRGNLQHLLPFLLRPLWSTDESDASGELRQQLRDWLHSAEVHSESELTVSSVSINPI